jgi:hypothetical protein
MGFIAAIGAVVAGIAGPAVVAIDNRNEDDAKRKAAEAKANAQAAAANASRDAQIAESKNNLLAMQAQAAVMELGILENSKNAQFQTLAWLTERMDAHDTKLEVAEMNAGVEIKEESNRHVEAMRAIELEAWALVEPTQIEAENE